MSEIAKLIEAKKQEMRNLDEQIRHLESALAVEQGSSSATDRRTRLQMAESVLQAERRYMKPRQISDAIQQKFGCYPKPRSLGTMLYRAAVERKKIFLKHPTQNNAYGLIEWGSSKDPYQN